MDPCNDLNIPDPALLWVLPRGVIEFLFDPDSPPNIPEKLILFFLCLEVFIPAATLL